VSIPELRYVVRRLRRRRVFAVTAVVCVGVGIGTATTLLSVGAALLVRPLPYPAADRLVAVWPGHFFASREVDAILHQVTRLDRIASLSPGWLMPLTHAGTPVELDVARISGDLFGLLGVSPLLGRPFGSEAEVTGQDRVAVLSYDLWQSAFGGDASIIGRSIVLSGEPYTVVAVMPRAFRAFAFTSDLWIPLPADHSAMWWTQATTLAFGRMRPDATVPQASAELSTIAPRVQRTFGLASDWASGARVVGLRDSMVGALRPMILLLTSAVGLLLTLATANVATLFLIRAADCRGEMAVRSALGARPGRLATLVVMESVVVGGAGGVLGLAIAQIGLTLLVHALPRTLPRLQEIGLDATGLLTSAVLTLIVTMIVAGGPAWQTRGIGSSGQLRSARTVSASGERLRGLLVSLEMALALVLLVGATLMGRTLVALYHVDTGLQSDHLLTMKIEPGSTDDEQLRIYWRTVLARVSAVSGVRSAATILHLPESGRSWNAPIFIEDRPLPPDAPPPEAHWQVISPRYFSTAGIQLLRGRAFDDTDGPQTPRVIAVNSAFAGRIFRGTNPVGHRIRAGNATNDSLATIVAVVASVRHDSLTAPAEPEVYVPFSQRAVDANSLVVRTTLPPLSLVAAIRDRIWSVDHNVPISDVRTMDDILSASLARQRLVLILLGLFATVGLLLSAVGVYGVVAFGVSRRVKEIGIRMALGANTGTIRRLVILDGLRYAALGCGVGLSLALALSGVMRQFVYRVPSTDWVSFLAAPVTLTLIAIAASWIPARRAVASDVTTALAE
jgi:putative ABC transport system permease protein